MEAYGSVPMSSGSRLNTSCSFAPLTPKSFSMELKMALRVRNGLRRRDWTYRIGLDLAESLPGILLLIGRSAVLSVEGGVRHGRRIVGRLSLPGRVHRSAVRGGGGRADSGLGGAVGVSHG